MDWSAVILGSVLGASLQPWGASRLRTMRRAFRRRGTFDLRISKSRAVLLQIGHSTAKRSFLHGRSVLVSLHRTPPIDLEESLRNRPLHQGDILTATKPAGGTEFVEVHIDRCFHWLGRLTILVQVW